MKSKQASLRRSEIGHRLEPFDINETESKRKEKKMKSKYLAQGWSSQSPWRTI